MSQPQWTPDPQVLEQSQITALARWFVEHKGLDPDAVNDYGLFQQWSVAEPEHFWGGVAEFLEAGFVTPPRSVLSGSGVRDAVWFEGATLNFADRLRIGADDRPAVIVEYEDERSETHTYQQLRADVAALARYLRELGVEAEDRVIGYLPNCYEGIVAFYATASIGAIWSQTGIDYNAPAAADRLGQLDAKVLVTGTGYVFRGNTFDRTSEAEALRSLLGSVEHTVVVPTLPSTPALSSSVSWDDAIAAGGDGPFETVPVPFDHPLWVLFTSGTTGKPKGIVHGHGGVLLEQLKSLGLHSDFRPGETFFWYTTPNWMMWNIQVSSLLFGATAVLYVGDPLYPSAARLWELVDRHRVNVFGTSPGQILATAASQVEIPACESLRLISSTGSPLPAAANQWIRSVFGDRVPISSVSGGTDVVGGFVGGSPISPVWDGEISARTLGVALEVWDDDGNPVVDQEGEMVITQPMPSMPVKFWDDADGSRYHDAYFSTYDGVWRQGDWITLTSRGTVIMHGRSDATLNRRGIRLGSAEIYDAVEALPDVLDSLVVGIDRPNGDYWMPIFVVPSEQWDEGASADRITQAIASRASKHHVPDEIILTPAVPRTRTGKKMEVPIKRILLGADPAAIGSIDSTDQPEALRWFEDYGKTRTDLV
ncbi:acetoacetate--CoA ligase [Leucobacter sp. G161]|uniref:acetoacetate--CoA ligase n=1 Tax=Leucobacter sp. G161 TaxID=663704 RepID=UPI00073B1614|nr:acetoacetate--CoA ligase [Leucobacter sp. G161]KUF07624.1 hypothetical protein AUL38_08065 [Leucobacter sp. G161]